MKKIILLISWLGVIPLYGQFQATLVNTVRGEKHAYQVYSDIERYRYEFIDDGKKGIVIVHPSENCTWILMPEKKYIYKTTCDDPLSRSNDPVQALCFYDQYADIIKKGEEKILGYPCEILEYYQGDTKIFTAWKSTSLNFFLKAVNHLEDNTGMEVSNIKEWTPTEKSFKEPDGYTRVDEHWRPRIPEPPAPENFSMTERKIPFEIILERGEAVHMAIPHDGYTKVIYRNTSEEPTKILWSMAMDKMKIAPDKQAPEKYRSHRLYPGDSKKNTFAWEKGSEIILEIYEGRVEIEVHEE